jgi:hypothetical protein
MPLLKNIKNMIKKNTKLKCSLKSFTHCLYLKSDKYETRKFNKLKRILTPRFNSSFWNIKKNNMIEKKIKK